MLRRPFQPFRLSSIPLQASTKPFTESTDSANMAFSASFVGNTFSLFRSTGRSQSRSPSAVAYTDNDHALALHSVADEVGRRRGEHPCNALQSSHVREVRKPLTGLKKSVRQTVSGCRTLCSYVVADARKIAFGAKRPDDPERCGHGDDSRQPPTVSIPGARRRQLAFLPPRPNPSKDRLVADSPLGLVLGQSFRIRRLVSGDVLVKCMS